MYDELMYEFDQFKKDFESGNFAFGKYFDEDDYSDDYSGNEIDEWTDKFIDIVTQYLRQHAPDKYLITSGWCVFVMTIEEAQKRDIIGWERFVVREDPYYEDRD